LYCVLMRRVFAMCIIVSSLVFQLMPELHFNDGPPF